MVRQDSHPSKGGCCHTPEAAEHLVVGPGIDLEPDRLVCIRSVEVELELNDLAGSLLVPEHCRCSADHQQGCSELLLHEHALRQPCAGSPPPFCVPSIPCESP